VTSLGPPALRNHLEQLLDERYKVIS